MATTWLDAFTPGCANWTPNRSAAPRDLPPSDTVADVLSETEGERARREITAWDGYAETPLHTLSDIAREIGVGGLWLKDESPRFGLGSFKALGGAYAVYRVLAGLIETETGARDVTSADLRSGKYSEFTKGVTVVTATDGNHGKSVAWGAQQFSCTCKIYIHAEVSQGRADAIAAYGAEMIRTSGDYDQSVRQADSDAAENGWHVVSDTSYPGYMEIPRHVMQGYTVLADEAARQMADVVPTHVFLPGGVGGVAAAITAQLWRAWSGTRPRFVIVEPDAADCLYQSALAGKPANSSGDLETVMACLSAGEVSLLAWEVLAEAGDAFMILQDKTIAPTMRRLADDGIVAGESGAASLAGLAAAMGDPAIRTGLALDEDSQVLVLSTEGATDPEIYQKLVGQSAGGVLTNRRS